MVTKKEICEIYAISLPTVNRMMKRGMPYYKVGKLVRFYPEEVKEWIEKSSVRKGE